MKIRDAILSAQDVKSESVLVPEWNNSTVYIRTMSGTERSEFESAVYKDGKVETANFYAELLVRCLADDKGALIFTSADVAALSAKSGSVLARLAEVASRVNALSPKAESEAKKG